MIPANRTDQSNSGNSPGRTSGQIPGERDSVGFEDLAPLFAVLRVKVLHLLTTEVAQPQRCGLDIERAPSIDNILLARGMDVVIANMSDAAKDDALGEPGRLSYPDRIWRRTDINAWPMESLTPGSVLQRGLAQTRLPKDDPSIGLTWGSGRIPATFPHHLQTRR